MDRWIKEGQAKGVENVMNYVMDAHLIDCLKRGLSPAISVEDAALWSSVIELSAWSEETNRPVPIPDFTQDRPAR
jgi:glycosyl hydrolase family 109 protein 2